MNKDEVIVVISGPSLKEEDNVSGISSVLKNIIKIPMVNFTHFIVGSKDMQHGYIGKVYRNIFAFFQLRNLLKVSLGSIYHSNTALNYDSIFRDYLFCSLAKSMGIPVLLHLHGGRFMTSEARNIIIRMFIRELFNQAKLVLVLSQIEKDNIEHWYNVNSEKIHILTNCVDFCGEKKVRDELVDGEKVRLLFFGRLHESKGVEEIVSAIEKMKHKELISLTVCGDGPLKSWFCDKMKHILGKGFIYRGIIKGSQKWEVFLEADYFLLPSRYGEGVPMALLETMSSGVVPITSANSSVTNLVNDLSGMIVKASDSASLQEALESTVCSRTEYVSKSLNCQRIIEDQYGCTEMREKLTSIYEEML